MKHDAGLHSRQYHRLLSRRDALTGGIAALCAGLTPISAPKAAQKPFIKIGELTSYQRLPIFTKPYRQGWMLAIEEINRNGGVLDGHKLAVISRDDGGTPADSQRVAQELIDQDKVTMLMGSSFAHIADAVSQYANRRPIPFLAIQPLTDHLTLERATRHAPPNPGASFLLRPSLTTQAAVLAQQAATLPAQKWTIIAPDYEFGRIIAQSFQADLQALRPDITIVATEWVPLAHIDAPATVDRLLQAAPDAIFNACFGPDMIGLFREGLPRGLFINRPWVSILTGEPEYLDDLHKIMVSDLELWGSPHFITTGYAPALATNPEHKAFRDLYLARYAMEPVMASVLGYSAIQAIIAALNKGKGGLRPATDADVLLKNMAGLSFPTPFGQTTLRKRDHQATLGVFVGRLAVVDNKISFVDPVYKEGKNYLPADDALGVP